MDAMECDPSNSGTPASISFWNSSGLTICLSSSTLPSCRKYTLKEKSVAFMSALPVGTGMLSCRAAEAAWV